MYIHAYTCLYMYMHVYTCIYIYIYMYLHVYIRWTFKPGLACTAWSSFWDLFGLFWHDFGIILGFGAPLDAKWRWRPSCGATPSFTTKTSKLAEAFQKPKGQTSKLERQHHFFKKLKNSLFFSHFSCPVVSGGGLVAAIFYQPLIPPEPLSASTVWGKINPKTKPRTENEI